MTRTMLSYLSITCSLRSTLYSWYDAPFPLYLFALSCWASHPAASAFVSSWKQQCDRSWVGVKDELWGNGQVLTAQRERERRVKRQKRDILSEPGMVDGKLRGLWHGRGEVGSINFISASRLVVIGLLADLKSAIPFICGRIVSSLWTSATVLVAWSTILIHLIKIFSYEISLVPLLFTAMSAGTECTKLKTVRQALYDDLYRSV